VVLEALRAGRRALHRLRVPEGAERGAAEEIVREAERAGVPVELTGERTPPERARVVLEAGPLPESRLEELLAARAPDRRIVVLDGVEDPQNLGAIARVADAAGALGLVVARRRSAPSSLAASRASAGALEWLPVARVPNLRRAMASLKEAGFWLVGALPGARDSIFDLAPDLLRGDLGVVLGSEGGGLRPSIVDALDFRVRIPMRGRVASLNVSAAAAVVLYELLRRTPVAPEVPATPKESR
jgi:23S rRNA (guanosine2251-2'-O)-methyltransferase